MHVRVSRVRRNGKTYEYAQLVESFRREDGTPAHRVVASLGSLSAEQVDNLRTALAAGRAGERVAVCSTPPTSRRARKPLATLRYLDLAVLLELWRSWKLDELLASLLGDDQAERVVRALVLHRCVDPQSKLHAVRWLPRTALPELLGLPSARFNNTRLHRVLNQLDQHGHALQTLLSQRVADRQDGSFVALYADVTDTWFVGTGPDSAQRGRTKEGRVEKKIGIVLLCNDEGLPLRWDVVPGNDPDDRTLLRMLESVKRVPWATQPPLVCDRAAGKTATIAELCSTGLPFLTALNATEVGKYAPDLPWRSLEGLTAKHPEETEKLEEDAAVVVAKAGMQRVDETQYTTDLGQIARPLNQTTRVPCRTDAVRHALVIARRLDESVRQGSTFAAAASAVGLGRSYALKHRLLLRLAESIQAAVLRGETRHCSVSQLIRIAQIEDPERQQGAFHELVSQPRARLQPPTPSEEPSPPNDPAEDPEKLPERLRCVAYFNPKVFACQRLLASQLLERLDAFLQDLNRRAQRPKARLTAEQMRRTFEQKLERHHLLSAFRLRVELDSNTQRPQLVAELDPDDWNRRRRYDGFTVLVGHAELPHSAERLSRLYRAKNAVEVNFHVIKSAIQLRPVRHRTDAKVRAHVTLCMLALLLNRTLANRLRDTSAEAALEILAGCAMHRWAGRAPSRRDIYSLTQLDTDQAALLRRLRMVELADDAQLAARIVSESAAA